MRNILILVMSVYLMSCSASKQNGKIYWVNSYKVKCEGVGNMNCLSVQQGDTIDYSAWKNFYASIGGFDYRPGYIYKLLVNEEKTDAEKTPADASSIKYTLVKVLEKKRDLRLKLDDIWVLESVNGTKINRESVGSRNIPQVEFKISEMRVSGTDGCNRFFGKIEKLNESELVTGRLASTKRACVGTDLPDEFNKALSKTVKYKVENLHLFLFDKTGEEILVFKKTD